MDQFVETPRRQTAELTAACPVRDVLDRVGDKWSALIVFSLASGPLRFGALRREITDISQRMLTEKLRNLQRDGMVERHVFPTTPPAVEYQLTDLGQSLSNALKQLSEWASKNHASIRSARLLYDVETEAMSQK
jgi:DNA-binding HxlR family transcriptional regulator